MLYYFKEKEVDQITLPSGVNVKMALCRYTDLRTIRWNFTFRVGISKSDTLTGRSRRLDDFVVLSTILILFIHSIDIIDYCMCIITT